jgi:peptidyl-prolyl cis-trans isomerase C
MIIRGIRSVARGIGPVNFRFAGLMILALLAACGAQTEDGTGTRRQKVGGEIAAMVNNNPIYTADVQLEAVAQGIVQPGETLAPSSPEFTGIVDDLVDQRLLSLQAEAQNLDKDDQSRHRLRSARERILGNILIENIVANQATDESVQKLYREQLRLLQLGDETRVRHIIVGTREEAQAIIKSVKGGEDFSTLAFQHSRDPESRAEGGDLGYVTADQFEEPFSAAIANTPVGEIADPFPSAMGWHVLRVEDRRTKAPPSLEEMRPQIMRYMTLQEIQKILEKLRREARVVRVVKPVRSKGSEDPFGPPPVTAKPIPEPVEDPAAVLLTPSDSQPDSQPDSPPAAAPSGATVPGASAPPANASPAAPPTASPSVPPNANRNPVRKPVRP